MNKQQLKELIRTMSADEVLSAGISKDAYDKICKNEFIWTPSIEGEIHYFIDDTGEIQDETYRELDASKPFWMSQGNFFKTYEQAEKYRKLFMSTEDEIAIKLNWVKNYIVCNNDGWRANWEDNNQPKYSVFYDYDTNSYAWECTFTTRTNEVYMSEEMAEQVVKILNNG